MAGFCTALGVSVVWLLLLAWVVGRTPSRRATEPLDAMAVAASAPGAAIVLAVGALVLAAWAIRHLVLQYLARRPGRIEVGRFAQPARLAEADAEELTIRFRRLLSTLRLQAPTPVPGAAPEGDFVDVLSRNGMDARNLLGSLLGLLRAAKPGHAYEVRGVLLDRREGPRHGVAIEVLRLPSQSLLSATVWGATWDEVLTEAADEATAAILPHTRRCLAPWGTWRGQVMPRGLLHAHEQGARFEQQRRYDEALRAYYRAVEADPKNMPLRLRLGQLQERMGLFLDALATYWGMEVTRAGSPDGWQFEPGARERRRRCTLRATAATCSWAAGCSPSNGAPCPTIRHGLPAGTSSANACGPACGRAYARRCGRTPTTTRRSTRRWPSPRAMTSGSSSLCDGSSPATRWPTARSSGASCDCAAAPSRLRAFA